MRNYSLLINKKFFIRNTLIFLGFFIFFFSYHNLIKYDNVKILLFSNLLMLIVFLISAFNSKWGFYAFIFFVPLLNTLTTILRIGPLNFPLFLFFAFFLGFLCSFFLKLFLEKFSYINLKTGIDNDLLLFVIIFIVIIFVSVILTVFRYSNFYPFVTNNYYNLKVSAGNFDSNSAIPWTIKYFFNYLVGFLVFFAVFNVFEKIKEVVYCIFVLAISTFFSFLMLLYQFFINPLIGSFKFWVNYERLNATFTDPNALGIFTMLVFPLFLALIFYFKKWYLKLIFSILTALIFVMVVLSGSRSALIGIVLSAIVFLVISLGIVFRKIKILTARKKYLAIVSIAIVICIIISAFLIVFLTDNKLKSNVLSLGLIQRTVSTFDTFISYFKSAGFIESIKSISNYRYIFWRMAVNMLKDYPVTGVGTGAYFIELPDYIYNYERGFPLIDFSGNYYLQVLSELGIVGFISIMLFFYFIIKKTSLFFLNRNIKQNKWVLAGLFISFISMLIIQIFGPHTNFFEIQFIFWTIIGLILVFLKITQYELQYESQYESDININGKKVNYSEIWNILKIIKLQKSTSLSKIQIVGLSIILLVFTISLFKSSVTTLSIAAKQDKNNWENEYGFYRYEVFKGKKVRWIAIDASTIIKKEGMIISFLMQDINPLGIKKPNNVKVYIDNYLAGSVKLKDDSWYNLKMKVPSFTTDRITLTIVSSYSWVPKELGITNDTRELAISIGEITFSDK